MKTVVPLNISHDVFMRHFAQCVIWQPAQCSTSQIPEPLLAELEKGDGFFFSLKFVNTQASALVLILCMCVCVCEACVHLESESKGSLCTSAFISL